VTILHNITIKSNDSKVKFISVNKALLEYL